MIVNYGLDTVRPGDPCPPGAPVGCTVEVLGAQEAPGAAQAVVSCRIHRAAPDAPGGSQTARVGGPAEEDGSRPPSYCQLEMAHQIRFGPAVASPAVGPEAAGEVACG